MSNMVQLTSQIYIKVNGSLVRDDIMSNLAEMMVDQHCHLPDMFSLRFYDKNVHLIDGGLFDLHTEVEVGAFIGERPIRLMAGEVTAVEPTFGANGIAELTVRGYDASHRLYRERKSRAFLNVRDSDIARQVAQEAGLQANVDNTEIIYEHLYQYNRSDLAFLLERAWRIGYECFVQGDTLHFRKPRPEGNSQIQLTWGENTLEIRPRMTVAERVGEVQVRGWDKEHQRPIVGRSRQGDLSPQVGAVPGGQRQNPNTADLPLGLFAGLINRSGQAADTAADDRYRLTVTDLLVQNQNEADLIAQARMDEISGAFLEMEGSVFRRPDVQAGRTVEIKGIGDRFSGDYLITNATHIYTPSTGTEVQFTVRGLRSGLLTEQTSNETPVARVFGPVTAVVTNNHDPKGWNRVKLTFPWLTEEAESGWARIVSSGPVAVPAVGDEVLVVFERGDVNAPYVLGILQNGRTNIPYFRTRTSQVDRSQQPMWHSSAGHRVLLQDVHGEQKMVLESAAGHKVEMDDTKKTLTVTTGRGMRITLDENGRSITIDSGGEIKLNASGNLSLDANGNINLTARGQVNVRGQTINLN